MELSRKEHMLGVFKGPLLKIKDSLLMMASLTDRNMTLALNAYLKRDDTKASLVEAEDEVIDRLEIDIDELVITYVSTHAPIATACRVALSASKISESLENIADQAVTIARRARLLSQLPELEVSVDIPMMANQTLSMMRDCIHAFVEVDPDLAMEIKARDKEVDALNHRYEDVLNKVMTEQPDRVEACIHTLLICRSIERAADYTKHIAEDVVFLYTAKDIRHRGGIPPQG